MEIKEKPPCAYGSKCYRKNPKHFASYSHPSDLEDESKTNLIEVSQPAKKPKLEKPDPLIKKNSSSKTRSKQTTLQFEKVEKIKNFKQFETSEQDVESSQKLSKRTTVECNKINCSKFEVNSSTDRQTRVKKLSQPKELLQCDNKVIKHDEESQNSTTINGSCLIHVTESKTNNEIECAKNDSIGASVEEIIKSLFLVDMPQCFYSFFNFCKSVNNEAEKALSFCGLKLVGPYDVLLGKMNLSVSKDLALCHWRFYYDPPEFQTVLTTNSEFHIGYWRDNPNEHPVFLASNNSEKDCVFKIEAENMFGTVFRYLGDLVKKSDPFTKVKITKFQTLLSEWAEKHEFSLHSSSSKITARQKNVVSKSFHKLGIVVPVEKKTELGYRPLIETDANLKKICKRIMEADNEQERETLWENLQPLINAANIANDECDFGNSLELGIDLFCMGSPLFHEIVEHLLTTAYSLLNRTAFEKIIRAHLKRRKKGQDLSVN